MYVGSRVARASYNVNSNGSLANKMLLKNENSRAQRLHEATKSVDNDVNMTELDSITNNERLHKDTSNDTSTSLLTCSTMEAEWTAMCNTITPYAQATAPIEMRAAWKFGELDEPEDEEESIAYEQERDEFCTANGDVVFCTNEENEDTVAHDVDSQCYMTDSDQTQPENADAVYSYSCAYITARVHGVPSEILVDSGANISLIREDVLKHIRSNTQRRIDVTHPKAQSGRTVRVGNGNTMSLGGEVQLTLTFDEAPNGARKNCTFQVVRDASFGILIGTDALHKMGAVLDFEQGQVALKKSNTRVPMRIQKTEERRPVQAHKVYSTDTTSFPMVGTVRRVGIKAVTPLLTQSSVRGYVVTDEVLKTRKGLHVGAGFIDLHAGQADVMVACLDNNAQDLQRGMLVGWFVPLSVDDEWEAYAFDLDVEKEKRKQKEQPSHTNEADREEEMLEQLRENQPSDMPKRQPWTEKEKDELIEVLELDKIKQISEDERQQLEQLLRDNADRFDIDGEAIGRTWVITHKIDTMEGAKPQRSMAYRESPAQREAMKLMMDKFVKLGFISPTVSEWCAPSMLVKKKAPGQWRFVIDYRKLNSTIKRDAYVMPRVDDNLEAAGGASFFSSFDATSGYHQIPLASEEDKKKSAFVNSAGMFAWNVVPQGEMNAPASFCRLMDIVLSGLKWQGILVFVDDILVYTKTFDEHLHALSTLFARLRAAGITLHPKKAHLLKEKILYLGHVISAHGVTPDPDKVRAVESFPVPKTKTDVKSFLGLTGYYRKFVPKYSYVAAPLNELTKGEGQKIEWIEGGAAHRAFEELKQRLISAPILAHPNWELPFYVQTDACHYGVSAILAQRLNKREVVIAYHSKTLTESQKKWGMPDKEAYAAVWACEKLRPYLLGREFVIQTDHEALKAAFEPNATRMLSRWAVRLQEFSFKVEPRPGKVGVNADVLSRYPLPETGPEEIDAQPREIHYACYSTDEALAHVIQNERNQDGLPQTTQELRERLRNEQKNDPKLQRIRNTLERPPRDGADEEVRAHYFVRDDVLYHVGKKARHGTRVPVAQIVVPTSMKAEIMTEMHNGPLSAHCGRYKTYERVRERFYWDGLWRDIKRWVDVCYLCATRKTVRPWKAGELQHIAADQPFHTVSVDVISFHKSNRGNSKVVVMTDHFTNWVEVKAVPDEKAETVADAIYEKIILQHSCPRRLLTDRGQCFRSKLLKRLCQRMSVGQAFTSGYHPQTNAKAERYNRFLAEALTHYLGKRKGNWDDHLDAVTFAYRTSYVESIEESPFFMLYGRDPRLPVDVMYGSPEVEEIDSRTYKITLTKKLREAHEAVLSLQAEARAKNKFLQDKTRANVSYEPNDWVLVWHAVKRVAKERKVAKKLLRRWEGPYRVLQKTSNVNYIVRHVFKGKTITVHVDRMAKYRGALNDVIGAMDWVDDLDETIDEEDE